MEVILEFFFSIFGEIILQILAEVLADLGFHSVAEALTPKEKRNPVLAFIGYIIMGAIVGGISLMIFPELLLENQGHAIGNIILTPVIAGLMMSLIGAIRRKRDLALIRLDSFLFGYIFALTMALVRYTFG